MDFADPFMGYTFLVLVDAYTKWPAVHIVKDMSVQNTIQKCREIFITFGLPQTIVSDNGRMFIAAEFKNFLKHNGIKHKCTAPYHTATNVLAERFVQTLKEALRKLNVTNGNIKTNLQKFLFQYRITHPKLNKSPAEAMFDRKLRSRLDLIFPDVTKEKKIIENINIARNFREGGKVVVRDYLNKNIKWRFKSVIKKFGKLHYDVKLNDEKIWKRYIDQMKAIGNRISDKTRSDNIDHNGLTETSDIANIEDNANTTTNSIPENFDSGSRHCSEGNKESEEGGTAEGGTPPRQVQKMEKFFLFYFNV